MLRLAVPVIALAMSTNVSLNAQSSGYQWEVDTGTPALSKDADVLAHMRLLREAPKIIERAPFVDYHGFRKLLDRETLRRLDEFAKTLEAKLEIATTHSVADRIRKRRELSVSIERWIDESLNAEEAQRVRRFQVKYMLSLYGIFALENKHVYDFFGEDQVGTPFLALQQRLREKRNKFVEESEANFGQLQSNLVSELAIIPDGEL